MKDLPTKEMLASYKKEFPEMRPEAVEAALIFMRQASLLLRDLEKYFAQHGLSQTRFLILILLDREANQEGLMAMDLVAKMDVSKTVISKTVHALEKEGLIKSEEHKQDARSKWLTLTTKGKKLLYDVLPGYYRIINRFMKDREKDEGK